MNNGTNPTKNNSALDLIALIISIVSILTCSSCFMLGIAGLVLSLIVLLDNEKKHNKTMGYVALALSLASMLFMVMLLIFYRSPSSNNSDNTTSDITSTTSVTTLVTETTSSLSETSTETTKQTTQTTTSTTTTTTVPTTTKAEFADELEVFNSGEYKYITLKDLHRYSPNMAGEKVYLVDKPSSVSEYSIGFYASTNYKEEVFDISDKDYTDTVKEGDTVAILGVIGECDGLWGMYYVDFKQGMVFAKGDDALKYAKETSDPYFEQYFQVTENVVKYLGSDASVSDYQAVCKQYDSTDILRRPNDYKNCYCSLSGRVAQIIEGWFGSYTIYIEDSSGNRWECSYSYSSSESHLLEGDYVTVYGELDGTTTAKTVLGQQVTMPKLDIKYIG